MPSVPLQLLLTLSAATNMHVCGQIDAAEFLNF